MTRVVARELGELPSTSSSSALRRARGASWSTLPGRGAPESALYVEAQDGRPYFIVPWSELYRIGTTDTRYEGDLDRVVADDEEIALASASRPKRKHGDIPLWAGAKAPTPAVGSAGQHRRRLGDALFEAAVVRHDDTVLRRPGHADGVALAEAVRGVARLPEVAAPAVAELQLEPAA